jgi:hypothetical protein
VCVDLKPADAELVIKALTLFGPCGRALIEDTDNLATEELDTLAMTDGIENANLPTLIEQMQFRRKIEIEIDETEL